MIIISCSDTTSWALGLHWLHDNNPLATEENMLLREKVGLKSTDNAQQVMFLGHRSDKPMGFVDLCGSCRTLQLQQI